MCFYVYFYMCRCVYIYGIVIKLFLIRNFLFSFGGIFFRFLFFNKGIILKEFFKRFSEMIKIGFVFRKLVDGGFFRFKMEGNLEDAVFF